MPEQPQKPPQGQVPNQNPAQDQGQKKPVPSGNKEQGAKPVEKPDNPPDQKKPDNRKSDKKTPAQKKDEGLKYEMTYVNGGFNNGVQIKPDKHGKALVEISIYGGGQKKTLSVGPLPQQIQKLVKAYEVSATRGQNTPEITGELQKYFEQKNTQLSQRIIQILTEADAQVAQAIKQTFK